MLEKGGSLARLEDRINFIQRLMNKKEIEVDEYYTVLADFVDEEARKIFEDKKKTRREK
jgi:hypothetical protein